MFPDDTDNFTVQEVIDIKFYTMGYCGRQPNRFACEYERMLKK